jgi:hypothetical protein
MFIAVTAPEKFDFQDLAFIELMLRFEANLDTTMFVERNEGEDAEIVPSRGTAEALIIEVQVMGASGPVTMADTDESRSHPKLLGRVRWPQRCDPPYHRPQS